MSEGTPNDSRTSPGRPVQEAQWIREIGKGSRVAFEKLFRAFERPLFHYFVRMVDDPSTAEELTIDTMVAVWQGAAHYRGASRPSTWIFGIAHHKALNELRRRRLTTSELEEASALADPALGPEASAARRDANDAVKTALGELSPEHREVLQLTFVEGYTSREIADILRCPVGTVKTRIHYAKRKLEPLLEEAGFGGGLDEAR